MQETAESIKIYGVLVPAIVRPREDGGYEIISGHRRKHTCELVRLKTTPVIVRDMDRDAATIIMVDNNLQRENILPSERAKAYKMRLETIRRKTGQAAKTVENSLEQNGDQVGHHFSYKNDATAFNGMKKGTISGKGVINNRMSNVLMAELEQQGVSTHFVQELSARKPRPLDKNCAAGGHRARYRRRFAFQAPGLGRGNRADNPQCWNSAIRTTRWVIPW